MEPKKHNTIYAYAVLGVLLIIATIGCLIVNMGNTLALQYPLIITAFVLGTSGYTFLYRAIKMDAYRLRDM